VRTATESKALLVEAVVPEWLKPYASKIAPLFAHFGTAINFITPYWNQGKIYALAAQTWIEPYHPEDLFPMAFGLVLIFFGGYFVTTIACIEAFRISGWDRFRDGILALWEDYQAFKQASDKDDAVDEDGDGIPDVNQIPGRDLVTRKMKLFLKSCDPKKLTDALNGIYTGTVSVLATLRLEFARTITLGSIIGDVLSKPAIKLLHPIAAAVVPLDYHKWIDVVIAYICKSIGVSIAWTLKRIVATIHSAMRGAEIFCNAFARWTARHGWTALSTGYWDEAFAGICAVFGFYFQLSSWFTLPWFLYIPLFPVVVFERVLTYVVAFS